MGAAMRCMTSDPAPLPYMMGSRPARITATVMALGRTRSTAPSRIASTISSDVSGRPCARRALSALRR